MNQDAKIKPYRTVFSAELVQETGLSTGGRDDGGLHADAILAKDGAGRHLLRGSGLAGALLATLDEFDIDIPDSISSRLPDGESPPPKFESLWLVHHAHVLTHASPVVRPNVAIDPWTGAAAEGAKFDTEILPRGTRWRMIIEVEDWRDSAYGGSNAAARLLAIALREWIAGNCWFGRAPARGLGWLRLQNLEIWRLNSKAAPAWPDANREVQDSLQAFLSSDSAGGVLPVTLDDLINKFDEPERRSTWHIIEGKLQVGPAEDGYGLDTLSTLAREEPDDMPESWRTAPAHEPVEGSTLQQVVELDSVPAWTRTLTNKGTSLSFMVPGAAIRGAIRSAMASHLRRRDSAASDSDDSPAPGSRDATDPLVTLFGSIDQSSEILVSDAYPADGAEPPEVYVLEQHAKDEFTQGVFGSSKFNRPCLVNGTFSFRIAARQAVRQAAPGLHADDWTIFKDVIGTVRRLGEARQLPVGGGIWRGHGWIHLHLSKLHDDMGSAESLEDASA